MEALKQIDKKRYDLELKEDGIDNLIKIGIAFSGKKVVIKAKKNHLNTGNGKKMRRNTCIEV